MKVTSYTPRSAPGITPAAVVARTMCDDDTAMNLQIPGPTFD